MSPSRELSPPGGLMRVKVREQVFYECGSAFVARCSDNPTHAGVANAEGWLPTTWIRYEPKHRVHYDVASRTVDCSGDFGLHLCSQLTEPLNDVIQGRCIDLDGSLTFRSSNGQAGLFAIGSNSNPHLVFHDSSSIGLVGTADVARPTPSAPSGSLGVANPGGA